MKEKFSNAILQILKKGGKYIQSVRGFLKDRVFTSKTRKILSEYGYYGALVVILTILGFASNAYRNRGDMPEQDMEALNEPVIVSAMITPVPTATPAPQENEIEYMMPLSGDVMTEFSPDALVWSETLEKWQSHNGMDIAGSPGENIVACADGIVQDAYSDPLWGNVIVMAHEDGMESVYANLGTLNLVSVGDSLSRGDIISTVGKSAAAESDMPWHVHFEFRDRDGNSVDFMEYANERQTNAIN